MFRKRKPRRYLDIKSIEAFVAWYKRQALEQKTGFVIGLFLLMVLPIGIITVQREIRDRSSAYQPVVRTRPPLSSAVPRPYIQPGCQVGGCSQELCADATVINTKTACVWKDAYACLIKSRCERQANGKCGWTKTADYDSCLKNIGQKK